MFEFLSLLGEPIKCRYETVEHNIKSASNSFYDSYLDLLEATVKTIAENEDIPFDDSKTCGAIVRSEALQKYLRESLGLEVGTRAIALVKSSSIIIMRPDPATRLSARNQLAGVVSRLLPGAVNCEVVLDLSGGGSIAAIVSNDSVQQLDLALHVDAVAVFKASSVLLGVAA